MKSCILLLSGDITLIVKKGILTGNYSIKIYVNAMFIVAYLHDMTFTQGRFVVPDSGILVGSVFCFGNSSDPGPVFTEGRINV